CLSSQDREDRLLRILIVVACRLAGLATEMQSGEDTLGSQRPRQRAQGRGLSRLARSMDDEIVATFHSRAGPGQALQGRHHVVERRVAGPGGVEAAHAGSISCFVREHFVSKEKARPPRPGFPVSGKWGRNQASTATSASLGLS